MIEKVIYEDEIPNVPISKVEDKTYIVPVVYYKRVHAPSMKEAIDASYRDACLPFSSFNYNVLENEVIEDS